ncbi:hypothetical protein [Chondromyces apiculatus]|uniref:Uncharacterized protein n=1 Tax=Chondromyces apiculatus DSM 436 TaxID=1192034 RepID=A0A017T185_9BACT|nr:hypothetical protein [Chondromyces apiculatus]EYF02983.1 Hypothetical protein CAP_6245 [Chondromyces apiculatus DSM 436]
MATVTHGTITITIDDLLAPPQQAGKLSKRDIRRTAKAPHSVGRLCNQAADALERAGTTFSPPPGITAQALRDAAMRVDGTDQCLTDLDVVREKFRQSHLIFGADAWKLVRQMNDHVKAQMKHDPEIGVIFQQLVEAFAAFYRRPPTEVEEDEEAEEAEEEPEKPMPAGKSS